VLNKINQNFVFSHPLGLIC